MVPLDAIVIFPDENGEVEIRCPYCSNISHLDRVVMQRLSHCVLPFPPCVILLEMIHSRAGEHRIFKNSHIPEYRFNSPMSVMAAAADDIGEVFYVIIKKRIV